MVTKTKNRRMLALMDDMDETEILGASIGQLNIQAEPKQTIKQKTAPRKIELFTNSVKKVPVFRKPKDCNMNANNIRLVL